MHVSVKWFKDQFNIEIASKEGKDPAVTIRGCRVVSGKDGDFIGYPATKNDNTGKWWNHASGSDDFNDYVLQLAQESKPREAPRPSKSNDRNSGGAPADFEDDIPF